MRVLVQQQHLLLDKHASEQLELIDALAERVQMLGGVAIAEIGQVAEERRIERAPDGVEEVGRCWRGCSRRTRRSSRRGGGGSRRARRTAGARHTGAGSAKSGAPPT